MIKKLRMMLFLMSTVAFYPTLVIATDCPHFIAEENLCVDLVWKAGPVYNAYSKAEIVFYEKGNEKKTRWPKKEVVAYPWMVMASMEHGSRPVVEKKIGEGVLEVSKIYLTEMAGKWDMRVRYKENHDKKSPLVKFNVDIP